MTCASPFARRTIWDGAQELAEIQAPYDSAVATLEELDSGWPLQPYNLLAGTDPNLLFHPLTYSLISGVAHGTLISTGPNTYRYQPATNYNGADSFTFRVNNGELDSAPA